MRFKIHAIFLGLSLLAPELSNAASPPAAELVCKKDGLSFAEDEACENKEGIVVNTSFGSKNFDECVYKAGLADKIPAHFTPWRRPAGSAPEAEAAAREGYCRGVWPDLTANGHTAAWSGEEMFTKIAISLESVELCKSRLTAADAVPVYSRLWSDGIDEFCGERVKPLGSGGSGSGKYRSRWDQVGGAWSTGWVPGHDEAICVNGLNCNCGTNACGNFKSGETTSVWPSGCAGPKWTIKCTSEAEEGDGSWGVADPISGGEGTWRKIEYVPGGGDTWTCGKSRTSPAEGAKCEKKGIYCTKTNGNVMSTALIIESFVCQ